MKHLFCWILSSLLILSSSAQNQFFYSDSDVLNFLNENTFSRNSTSLKFSQNGAFLNVGNSVFNNPSVKIISNTTAYIKYFLIKNPSIVASLIVDKNGEYVIDRSSNTKYEMYSAFDQLERIRLGEHYNETSEQRGRRLYQEMVDRERIERENLEKERIKNAILSYYPNKSTYSMSGKKKFTDLAGNDFGFDVIQVDNNFIQIGNTYPDSISYSNAQIFCNKISNGWRLPTKKEMQAIINRYDNGEYWTSSKENTSIWTLKISHINEKWKAEPRKIDVKTKSAITFIPVRDIKIKSLKPLYDDYFIGKPVLIDAAKLIKFSFSKFLSTIENQGEETYYLYGLFDEKAVADSKEKNKHENWMSYVNKGFKKLAEENKTGKIDSIKFEVSQYAYPNELTYNEHLKIIQTIGNGWRLPTALEFCLISIMDKHSYDFQIDNDYSKYPLDISFETNAENFLINYNGLGLITGDPFYRLANEGVDNTIRKYIQPKSENRSQVSLILVKPID